MCVLVVVIVVVNVIGIVFVAVVIGIDTNVCILLLRKVNDA